ncbi:hypothetical protein NL676_002466 [Syzygium grande]|nr:hypothetical protein NL676_002466 [Syzygium grande]
MCVEITPACRVGQQVKNTYIVIGSFEYHGWCDGSCLSHALDMRMALADPSVSTSFEVRAHTPDDDACTVPSLY